ncbi:MAG: hypothetical protein WDZ76_03915 [Pseudohongiellaceae bacterium]
MFQNVKNLMLDVLNVSQDAAHMHLGLLVFFISVIVWKRGRLQPVCLLPVFILACGLEMLDLYDNYVTIGRLRWANSMHDIINTLLWPALIVLFARTRLFSSAR